MIRLISTSIVALSLVAGSVAISHQFPAHASSPSASIVAPKPIGDSVNKGIAYLISQQHSSGGWTEGEESQYMRSAGHANREVPNVADTSMTTLALMRAGSFPNSGKYSANVQKAIAFICSSIEESDADSLSVSTVRGTRVQAKLGPNVDTFLASLALSEAKDHMANSRDNQRVSAALAKVIHKIEKNQNADGTWSGGGWAPVHSQALAAKGLNRAKQVGALVKDDILARAENYSKGSFDAKTSSFSMAGAASVPLYAAGAGLGALQESINTGRNEKAQLEKIITSKTAPQSQQKDAEAKLQRLDSAERAQQRSMDAVVGRLEDASFVSGFGCNGGEEFLSYLHISETLLANNSQKWPSWDKSITTNINKVQGQDGSWMGQHCITSRTFCTSAALLVLMADRAPQLVNLTGGGRKTASR